MARSNRRSATAVRPIEVVLGLQKDAEGSVLFAMGNTRVLCAASIEEKVPPFLKGTGKGWVTAEYAMLPRATNTRTKREGRDGKVQGRTQEIQRLIGRSLRAVVDLNGLGERTITLDCDVLQADGGTRTASVNGAWIALHMACARLVAEGKLPGNPVGGPVTAVSVGIVGGKVLVDLDYPEDSTADVDMNLVMTGDGRLVEVQGTAEREPFSTGDLAKMLAVGTRAAKGIAKVQKEWAAKGAAGKGAKR